VISRVALAGHHCPLGLQGFPLAKAPRGSLLHRVYSAQLGTAVELVNYLMEKHMNK
jgi:hypothetical protein